AASAAAPSRTAAVPCSSTHNRAVQSSLEWSTSMATPGWAGPSRCVRPGPPAGPRTPPAPPPAAHGPRPGRWSRPLVGEQPHAQRPEPVDERLVHRVRGEQHVDHHAELPAAVSGAEDDAQEAGDPA